MLLLSVKTFLFVFVNVECCGVKLYGERIEKLAGDFLSSSISAQRNVFLVIYNKIIIIFKSYLKDN